MAEGEIIAITRESIPAQDSGHHDTITGDGQSAGTEVQTTPFYPRGAIEPRSSRTQAPERSVPKRGHRLALALLSSPVILGALGMFHYASKIPEGPPQKPPSGNEVQANPRTDPVNHEQGTVTLSAQKQETKKGPTNP